MTTPRQKKSVRRILSVKLKHMIDESPDTSWLGEFADEPKDYAIVAVDDHEGEFLADLPCECGHAESEHYGPLDDYPEATETDDEPEEGDCKVCVECTGYDQQYPSRGRTYRFFNPNADNYTGEPEDEIKRYCKQDYDRMRALVNGDFCFIGIAASAEITLRQDSNSCSVVQTVHSGGLWGIESDSDADYLKSIEDEQLAELRSELEAVGFSTRAIDAAYRKVEHKDA